MPSLRDSVTPSAASLALEISDLRFRYADADRGGFALELPSLRVAAGEQVLLTGGSGTGKSTLLQLIAGLIDPASGSISIGGTPIHGLHGAARDRFRGRSIGMIFQTFQLAQGFSAIENVQLALLFGAPSKERVAEPQHDRAAALLTSLGIERPHAMVETLSVGQQQRVAVARALACRPALVLADEPTASLDPANAKNAVALIRATCREEGSALLVVSHDPSLIGQFDRHVELASLVPLSAGAAS